MSITAAPPDTVPPPPGLAPDLAGVGHAPIETLTPRQLMWLRFRKHRLAHASLWILGLVYLIALFCDVLTPMNPETATARFAYHPPQPIHLFETTETGSLFRPHVVGMRLQRDPVTLRPTYTPDPARKIDVGFLVASQPYALWGVIPLQTKLFGAKDRTQAVFFAGADRLGRDMLSRTIQGTRISMSIGLVGVTISLILGIVIGGISGYFGGKVDWVIQRIIEFKMALPTIPIWMALAAALPKDWSQLAVYFMITLIVSLIGWTDLARVVRGRFLSLRTEDFVIAARIDGCSEMRIILRQMLPSFMSHIIASVTLAIPLMILAETSLSFLGLGLQPPTISWGVLLKEAQNIRSIASAPWLFMPGVAVVTVVLALNFLGDGLRDAADPYA
jgi:peptide/nickel transport system permease protein